MALFGLGAPKKDEEGLYSYSVRDIDGKNLDIAKYRGKVLLVVNVASQCGFTTQYEGLTELHNKYKSKGFEILAFPCNQFGSQEPGDAPQIKSFASNRGAKFQLADKVDVNGTAADPLFQFLKSEKGGFLTKDIKWNFTKFLCNKEGQVIKRYGTSTEPSAFEEDIVAALA
ncbi:hypothetical protein WJX84_010980 [Apatococcus fuscideae]|uniref:Glutathione peroxidase n=1 Tax=Apatococcus fuscideae TaxID=2026836 RepID=A0AAW1T2T9_9CHLO